MKRTKEKMANLILGVLLITAGAYADDISIGVPNYGGTGCPQGSASATLSPDFKSLSILFDSYAVQAQGAKTLDRKSCNIAIPIHVPQGLSVSIFDVDYRGYNGLPDGATSELDVDYFFAGMRGPSFRKPFVGPLDENYIESHELAAGAIVWSRCGADTNLRINSSMRVRTNSMGDQALSTVDSVDMNASLLYLLQWRSC